MCSESHFTVWQHRLYRSQVHRQTNGALHLQGIVTVYLNSNKSSVWTVNLSKAYRPNSLLTIATSIDTTIFISLLKELYSLQLITDIWTLARCSNRFMLPDTGGHVSCQQLFRRPDVVEAGPVSERQRWTEPRGLCEERPTILQVTEENRERWRAAGVVWQGSHWAAAPELRQKSSEK